MKKKVVSIALLCALLASVGCGSSDGGADTPTGTTAPSGSDATTTQPEETSEFQAADVKYSGKDFIIAENDIGDWMQSAFITEENGDVLNDSIYKRNSIVEDLYGINLKGYKIEGGRNSQDLASIKNTILAGDKEFDIAYIPGQLCKNILSDPQYLIPLSDLDTIDLSHSWWAQNSVEEMTFGGKTVSATGDMIVTTTGSTTVTFFNKTLAEQYNLDIYNTVREGKFTLDYVYNTGKTVSADLNGDAKRDADNDRFGLIVESLNLMHTVNTAGEKLITKDSEGYPVCNVGSSAIVDIVQKYVSIIDDTDNVISVQDGRITDGGPAGVFNSDRAMFWYTNLQRMKAARSFDAEFGLVPLPKYDESDEYIGPVGGYWDSWLMIPATQDDTDYVGNVVEALGYYSQQYVTPAFIETSVTTKTLRDDDSAEMLEIVLANRSFDAGMYFGWGYDQLIGTAVDHNPNFASLIAADKSKIDASIAEFVKNFKN